MYTIDEEKVSQVLTYTNSLTALIKPLKLQIALIQSSLDPTNQTYKTLLESSQAQLIKLKKEEIPTTITTFLGSLYSDLDQIQANSKAVNLIFHSQFSANLQNFRSLEQQNFDVKTRQNPLKPQIDQLKGEISRLQQIIKTAEIPPNLTVSSKLSQAPFASFFTPTQQLNFTSPEQILPQQIKIVAQKKLSLEIEERKIDKLGAENQILREKNSILQQENLILTAKVGNMQKWAQKEVLEVLRGFMQ